PRITAKQKLSPRNLRRANAKAAGMLMISLPAVVTTAMNRLFQNQFATGKYRKASGKFDSVGVRGRIWMSRVKTSVGILNDVESIHSIGKSVIAHSRITTRWIAPLPSRRDKRAAPGNSRPAD